MRHPVNLRGDFMTAKIINFSLKKFETFFSFLPDMKISLEIERENDWKVFFYRSRLLNSNAHKNNLINSKTIRYHNSTHLSWSLKVFSFLKSERRKVFHLRWVEKVTVGFQWFLGEQLWMFLICTHIEFTQQFQHKVFLAENYQSSWTCDHIQFILLP